MPLPDNENSHYESTNNMPILDYTTKVPVARTVAEIEAKLARAKAEAILKEYDRDGIVSALSFRIRTEFGVLTFLLPANIGRVYQVIVRDKRISPSLRTREQAARIAWRIVKDWIEAQLAMIEAGLVDLQQVFLPYAQDTKGRTFYELMRERKFQPLLPESNSAN
jgi:hypothetical protein